MKVKNELPPKIEAEATEEQKAKIKNIADKYKQTETPPQTAPTDITNKLTDEGYSKADISRIVSDLYQKNPNGDFTEEQINQAKENYIPKGKDAATVIADRKNEKLTSGQVDVRNTGTA